MSDDKFTNWTDQRPDNIDTAPSSADPGTQESVAAFNMPCSNFVSALKRLDEGAGDAAKRHLLALIEASDGQPSPRLLQVLGTSQPEDAEKEWDAVSVRVHRVEELEDKCLRPVGTDGRRRASAHRLREEDGPVLLERTPRRAR